MPFQISLIRKITTPKKVALVPLNGVEKMGPGRFEFLDAIRTHINIKLKMGIQKHTGAVYCSLTNHTMKVSRSIVTNQNW